RRPGPRSRQGRDGRRRAHRRVPRAQGRPERAARRRLRAEPARRRHPKKLELAARFRAWLGTIDPGTRWGQTGTDCGKCRALGFCDSRGCDGREQLDARGRARVVWRAPKSALTATTCPVLAFTPEVESALRWFDATHELEVGFGAVRWR